MLDILGNINLYPKSFYSSTSSTICVYKRKLSKRYETLVNNMIITKADNEILQKVLYLTKANNSDVKLMQEFMIKYIDPNVHICLHCGGQIRFAHKRLLKWYEQNKESIIVE